MQTYTYIPLNLDEPTFRLVRLFGGLGAQLQCEIVHALLAPKDMMDYEAVSYTWGCPVKSIFFIEVHGETIQKLTISPNLYHMLLDLRNPYEDRMLWIDAICINQDAQDTGERNHQVQQMARIYGQAQRVVVWLGESTHETSIAMGSLIKLQSLYKNIISNPHRSQALINWKDVHSGGNQDNPKYLGIKQIFGRPWFQRIWILQEVGNARRALIYCGKKSVSSAIFSLAPSLFNITVNPHCQSVLDLMPGSPARSKTPVPRRDLWTLLRRFRYAEATIEHDYIYALLGLCSGEAKDLRVSYEKPISTIISEVISLICHWEITSTPRPLYNSVQEFQADLDQLHEQVLVGLANQGCIETMRSMLESDNFNATENIMIAAATNLLHGKRVLDVIISRARESAVTDNVVSVVIKDQLRCRKLLDLIFPQAPEPTISKSQIIDFIKNMCQDRKILNSFFQKVKGSEIIMEVVIHVVCNRRKIEKAFHRVLGDTDRYTNIEPELIDAIYKTLPNNYFNDDWYNFADMLHNLEKVEAAAVLNTQQSGEILDLILQYADKFVITDEAKIRAIETVRQSRNCPDILIQAYGNLLITERVVRFAVCISESSEDFNRTLQYRQICYDWKSATKDTTMLR
ncbi:heterokaryon incompatibility protein-domain-containing protein [Xylaria curta]|nr:heterokaryon incompatibility protein-domain-containing protein [Xylaria curta]